MKAIVYKRDGLWNLVYAVNAEDDLAGVPSWLRFDSWTAAIAAFERYRLDVIARARL